MNFESIIDSFEVTTIFRGLIKKPLKHFINVLHPNSQLVRKSICVDFNLIYPNTRLSTCEFYDEYLLSDGILRLHYSATIADASPWQLVVTAYNNTPNQLFLHSLFIVEAQCSCKLSVLMLRGCQCGGS